MRQHDPANNTPRQGSVMSWHYKPLANGSFNNQNHCKLCKKLFILKGRVEQTRPIGALAYGRPGVAPPVP
jgi:hypothetical protein